MGGLSGKGGGGMTPLPTMAKLGSLIFSHVVLS